MLISSWLFDMSVINPLILRKSQKVYFCKMVNGKYLEYNFPKW